MVSGSAACAPLAAWEPPDPARPAARFARALWVAFAEARRWVAARRIASRLSFFALPRTTSGHLSSFAACLVLAACGAAPPTGAAPTPPPLSDFLPAGASLVVLAEPVELMAEPALRRVVEALFAPERLDAFQAYNGIDPRRLEGLAWAEYETGTVVAIRGPFHAEVAVAEMAHRMMPVESESDEPFYRRAGIYAGQRRDAIAIDEHTLVLVTGAPVLAGRALASGAPRALDEDGQAVVAALPAPFVVLWPRPLAFPPDTGVGLLFARERALGVALTGEGEGVRVEAEARGEFPPGVEDNLQALFGSLARSDLGHQLGMLEAEGSFSVEATSHGVRASAQLSSSTLARGLRALLIAELAEIVGEDLVGTGASGAPPEGAARAP